MFSSRKAAPPAFDNIDQAASYEQEAEVRVVQQRSEGPHIPAPSLFQGAGAKPFHGAGEYDVHAQTEMARQYAAETAGQMPRGMAPADDPEDARLCIGRAIKMKGSVQDCGVLQVDGHFEASAQSKHLKVAETGIFVGDADVHSAEIIGRFEGNLTVKDKLVIRTAGLVSGNVKYGSIEIEDGGRISGDIEAIRRNEPPEDLVAPSKAAGGAPQEGTPDSNPPRLNLSEGRREAGETASSAGSAAPSDTVAPSDRVETAGRSARTG